MPYTQFFYQRSSVLDPSKVKYVSRFTTWDTALYAAHNLFELKFEMYIGGLHTLWHWWHRRTLSAFLVGCALISWNILLSDKLVCQNIYETVFIQPTFLQAAFILWKSFYACFQVSHVRCTGMTFTKPSSLHIPEDSWEPSAPVRWINCEWVFILAWLLVTHSLVNLTQGGTRFDIFFVGRPFYDWDVRFHRHVLSIRTDHPFISHTHPNSKALKS